MLIEFRVKNFKSIRDEQVFSMAASKDTEHRETHVITGLKNCPDLLKSAVIYGPNASGKSNLIDAMDFMCFKVLTHLMTLDTHDEEVINRLRRMYLNCTPFRLSEAASNTPSEFELSFWAKGVRYQYGFAILREQIVEEWLIVYETTQPQKWFERVYDLEKKEYSYTTSKYLKGQKKVWQEATRPDALFLTTAAALNNEQLRKVARYVYTHVLTADVHLYPDYLMQRLHEKTDKAALLDFLKSADLGVEDIDFRKEIIHSTEPDYRSSSPRKDEASTRLNLYLKHKGTKPEWFPWNDESSGTIRFLGYAYYLFIVLSKGYTLVVDEIDSNMHLLMLVHILKMFNSESNKHAQLIFTTHNVSLLNAKFLRRDQVWFMEKSQEGATELFSLAEFGIRKNENYMRQYLSGAYGALPFFTEFHPNAKENVTDAAK